MRAPIHFVTPDLNKWDKVSADALVLTLFRDERPLRGAAGLADWRLCGRLSRLLQKGYITGEGGETVVMPPAGRRLRFPRIFVIGLGDADGFGEERYCQSVRTIRRVLARAKVDSYAVQPPGRATGLIAPRRALELWLEQAEQDECAAEVTLVEAPAGQKEMAKSLRASWKDHLGSEGESLDG